MSLVAEIDEETGEISTNVTTSGIMINLLSFMGGIRDLSRFWYGNDLKKISLYEYMTNDDYPIKTIFAKPNDTEGEMSNGLLRAALVYCMALIDSPSLSESKVPKIGFYLDEIHSVGKLENEIGQPLISRAFDRGRSKGISMNITCQSLNQLIELYNENTVVGWREASSNFYLTGTSLGKTADTLAGSLGDRAINKTSTGYSSSDSGASSNVQTQTHMDKIMFSSEFSSELVLTETGIKFYYQGRGLPNVYIVDKTFIEIPDHEPHWIEREQKHTAMNLKSRVMDMIDDSMGVKKKKSKTEPVRDRFAELDQEYADLDDVPDDFQDNGQFADEPTGETESSLKTKFAQEYDVTPEFDEDEDDLGSDMIKDKVLETMTDSHAINVIKQVWELLASTNTRVKTTDYKKKVEFDNKKRYKQSFTGIEQKKEKESA